MKKTVLCLVLTALLTVPVLAAPEDGETLPGIEEAAEGTDGVFSGDFSYTGVVDAETGYPEGTVRSATSRLRLSDGMSYDREQDLFVFPIGDGGSEIACTAADGMILTEAVTVRESGDDPVTVYRDGLPLEREDWEYLSAPGEYAIYAGTDATGLRLAHFTLTGPYTNRVFGYAVPEGFLVSGAVFEGEDTGYDRYYVDMEREGTYHIDYRIPSAERSYALDVTVDRTPPTLTLSGKVGEDGRVRSAVTVTDLEPDCTMHFERDGVPDADFRFTAGEGVISEPGYYTLRVTDPAGNETTYEFTILVYFDLNSLIFFALVLGVLALTGGYALFKRKHLRLS